MNRIRISAASALLTIAALTLIFFPFAPVFSYENEPEWYSSPAGKDIYVLSGAGEFEEFLSLIDQGCDFAGKTVYLTSSVDLSVGAGTRKVFRGNFDGLCNTVTIGKSMKSAIFNELEGAEIRNLKVTSGNNLPRLLQGEYGGIVANNAVNTIFDGVAVGGVFNYAPEDDDSAGAPMYFGAISGYAESASFINCTSAIGCGGVFGAFAGIATGTSVENSMAKGSGYLIVDALDCIYINVLTYEKYITGPAYPETEGDPEEGQTTGQTEGQTPDPEGPEEPEIPQEPEVPEGIVYFDKSLYTAEQIVTLMNEGRIGDEEGEYNEWLLSDGEAALHAHACELSSEPSTCTVKGRAVYTCTDCGKTLLEYELPLAGHTLSGIGEVFAPTCTGEGYTLCECSVCLQKIKTDIVPALGHTPETVGAIDATCVQAGYSGDEICSVCGALISKGKTVKATGIHDWSNTVITKQPTGDEPGEITYYCTMCGRSRTETLPPIGHIPGEYVYYNEQYHRADCSCGEDHLYEEHDWDSGRVTKEPTGDDPGQRIYTCRVCGGVRTEEISPIGHELGPWRELDEEYHYANCKCGEIHREKHRYDGGTVISDGIIDESGVSRTLYTCLDCGAQKMVELEVPLPAEDVPQPRGGGEEKPYVDIREEKKKYAIIGAIALLFLGGIGATVLVKKSDRK